jgi:hypothetical protein
MNMTMTLLILAFLLIGVFLLGLQVGTLLAGGLGT